MKIIRFFTSLLLFFIVFTGISYANSGLPQFDSSQFSKQIFWLIVLFTTLFLFLSYYFIPKVRDIQVTRSNKVLLKIEKAEKNRKEVAILEKQIISIKKEVLEKENKINTDLNKKISLLNHNKNNSFTEYKVSKNKELDNQIFQAKQEILNSKDEYIESLSTAILEKIK